MDLLLPYLISSLLRESAGDERSDLLGEMLCIDERLIFQEKVLIE